MYEVILQNIDIIHHFLWHLQVWHCWLDIRKGISHQAYKHVLETWLTKVNLDDGHHSDCHYAVSSCCSALISDSVIVFNSRHTACEWV